MPLWSVVTGDYFLEHLQWFMAFVFPCVTEFKKSSNLHMPDVDGYLFSLTAKTLLQQ